MNKYVFFVLGFLATTTVTSAAVSTFQDGLVVGGTSLTSGLLVEVEGRLGAQEVCNESGTECTDVSNIYNFVSSGTGVTGTAGYIPYFNTGTSIANSALRQSSDGNIGIGVAGMANGDTQSSRLRVSGNLKVDSRHLYLGNQDLYGDNNSALYYDSNHSTLTQIVLRDAENVQYGRVHGSGNGYNFGLLDGDGHWAIRHIKDSSTSWRINNIERMRLTNVGLGINGTVVPDSALQIGTNSVVDGRNYISFGDRVATTQTNMPYIGQTSNSGGDNSLGLGAHSGAGSINFFTGNGGSPFAESTRRMIITPGGNVGIGDLVPDAGLRLDVSGNVGADAFCDADGTNCIDWGTAVWVNVNEGEDSISGQSRVYIGRYPAFGSYSHPNTDTCNSNDQVSYTCPASASGPACRDNYWARTSGGNDDADDHSAYTRMVDCDLRSYLKRVVE